MGQAVAQHATLTPTPAYTAGVTAEILGRIEPPAAPGYTLQLVRVIFAPGAAVAFTDRAISILTVIVLGGIAYALSKKVRRAHGAGSRGSQAATSVPSSY